MRVQALNRYLRCSVAALNSVAIPKQHHSQQCSQSPKTPSKLQLTHTFPASITSAARPPWISSQFDDAVNQLFQLNRAISCECADNVTGPSSCKWIHIRAISTMLLPPRSRFSSDPTTSLSLLQSELQDLDRPGH